MSHFALYKVRLETYTFNIISGKKPPPPPGSGVPAGKKIIRGHLLSKVTGEYHIMFPTCYEIWQLETALIINNFESWVLSKSQIVYLNINCFCVSKALITN